MKGKTAHRARLSATTAPRNGAPPSNPAGQHRTRRTAANVAPRFGRYARRQIVSKQRRHIMRKKADGFCIYGGCHEKVDGNYREAHRRKVNVQTRERLHRLGLAHRRNLNSASYHYGNGSALR